MTEVSLAMLAAAERSLAAGLVDPFEYRRCASASYYAVYHALAKAFADALIGSDQPRPDRAWIEVYRGLDHKTCADACRLAHDRSVGFPAALLDVAGEFGQLQRARHEADYHPTEVLTVDRAEVLIQTAKTCIEKIAASSQSDLKAFAVWILFKAPGTTAARKIAYPSTKEQETTLQTGNPAKSKSKRRLR